MGFTGSLQQLASSLKCYRDISSGSVIAAADTCDLLGIRVLLRSQKS